MNVVKKIINHIFNAVKDRQIEKVKEFLAIDKVHNIEMQKLIDDKIQKHIESVAYDKLQERLESEKTNIYRPFVIPPIVAIYDIFDEQTAKFKDANIADLVFMESEKLYKEYKAKSII